MNYHKRTDKNQKAIVEALRKIGCSVFVLSDAGQGLPDLLVGVDNFTLLLEVKTKDNWYGKKGLSETQNEFKTKWKGGLLLIVYDPEDAVNKVQNEIAFVRQFKGQIESSIRKQEIKKHIITN